MGIQDIPIAEYKTPLINNAIHSIAHLSTVARDPPHLAAHLAALALYRRPKVSVSARRQTRPNAAIICSCCDYSADTHKTPSISLHRLMGRYRVRTPSTDLLCNGFIGKSALVCRGLSIVTTPYTSRKKSTSHNRLSLRQTTAGENFAAPTNSST